MGYIWLRQVWITSGCARFGLHLAAPGLGYIWLCQVRGLILTHLFHKICDYDSGGILGHGDLQE